jgi:hypothetical protein
MGSLLISSASESSSTEPPPVPVSRSSVPLYQLGESIFYLLVGSSDPESGLYRGCVEGAILPCEIGHPSDNRDVAYLISQSNTGSLFTVSERFIKKNKAPGILVSLQTTPRSNAKVF